MSSTDPTDSIQQPNTDTAMSLDEKNATDGPGASGSNNPTQDDGESFHSFHKSHSNESGGSGGSHHSSGMLSIGNTSFGFAFDNDAMMRIGGCSSGAPSDKASSEGDSSDSNEKQPSKHKNTSDASATAEANVANLQSLARLQVERQAGTIVLSRKQSEPQAKLASSAPSSVQFSHNDESLADSHDHDADDDEDEDDDTNSRSTMDQHGDMQPRRKKKRLDERKRVERNAREKERSFRISKQINELRNLLGSGGVIVPKGTKSSVLTEAASYIRMLQQHQYRSEIDRHQLIQQMQLIGGGAHGSQAAQAVRHVAAQNGVWSLGNFGGVPPKTALTTPNVAKSTNVDEDPPSAMDPNKVSTDEYRFIFNSCGVGMAIASMGGAFIDCNQLFCQLSNYTKQEVCSLTIFNLTSRQDLQTAFDLISQLISPPMEGPVNKAICVRGAFKNRDDLGLCVNIVKGEDGIAKCFCVTIVKNPNSPFESAPPVPVSFESIVSNPSQARMDKVPNQVCAAPAFTSG